MFDAILAGPAIMVSARSYFRPHYFQCQITSLALLTAVGVVSTIGKPPRPGRRRAGVTGITIFVLAYVLWGNREICFMRSPTEISRAIHGDSPFPDAEEIGLYINEFSDDSETVAVMGSEHEIMSHANFRSATPYMHMYPLMESHDYALEMHREVIADVETAKPRYIVFVSIPTSWAKSDEAAMLTLDWIAGYLDGNYLLIGAVNYLGEDGWTKFIWEDPESRKHIQGTDYMLLFWRRDLALRYQERSS